MTLQDYNDLFKLPTIKQINIYIPYYDDVLTNESIVSESMSLSKSLCSESNLRYGRCEASCFKIRIADYPYPLEGKTLIVEMDVATDSRGYLLAQNGGYILTQDGKKIKLDDFDSPQMPLKLGHFKVYSDKPSNDRRWRDLVCYDWMYDLLHLDASAWYNNLIFPLTLQDLRYSFFAEFFAGKDVTRPLINDALVVQKGFVTDGSLSGKLIMESILELNGVFGYIDPETNMFDYLSLPEAEELTLDYYQDGTGSYEDYVTRGITGVRAIGSNNDAGTTVGETWNLYMIENNPIIYGIEGTQALEDALDNLWNHIKNDSFRPFKVTTYGNPMLPLGTKVTIDTKNETIVSYVVSKEMTGIQSLKDTYEAKSEESQPQNTNSVANEIKRTKGQIVLKVDANGKIVQAMLSADADTGSEFKVQADNISFIANDTIDLESANLSIKADNFYINPDGSFGSSDGTNPTFSVAANGNVYVKGNIVATSGTIGGWKATSTALYDATADTVGAEAGGIGQKGSSPAFWAGTYFYNRNNAPFKVEHDGSMTAKKGNIAGFTITDESLYRGHQGSYVGITSDTWTLGIGSSSYTSYADAHFRVSRSGVCVARNITISDLSGDSSLTSSGGINLFNSTGYGGSLYIYDANGDSKISAMARATTSGFNVDGGIICDAFVCSGSKSRIVETEDYGNKLLYCYETPTPMFGDIGEGKIAEDGKCYVWLDSTFSETIKTESYQVFLQKYGQGECYVTERTSRYFVVEGDIGMVFGWEIKARQAGFENLRLENYYEPNTEDVSINYGSEANEYLKKIKTEREVA